MPSRRNNAPISPGLVQRSAAFKIRRFSALEKWRRFPPAATSGSGAALEAAPPVALRAPSPQPPPPNPRRPATTIHSSNCT